MRFVAYVALMGGTAVIFPISIFAQETLPAEITSIDRKSSGDTILLDPITLYGKLPTAEEVFTAPQSSIYISNEELNRYGLTSAADLLKGQPGVQVGDSRNGGGLDVNIRGIQGQGRVAVTVDGTQQALDVYRGYSGTQQRSYIDPDLISDVVITKGPTLSASTGSAIGGTVGMSTLRASDILKPGKKFGVRIKGGMANNAVKPPSRPDRVTGADDLKAVPRTGGENLTDSDARSGSLAFAYAGDRFDLVAAYAQREQGNFFAGVRGREQYVEIDEHGREVDSVAKAYDEDEEVLNSSSNTKSGLLKANINITSEQHLELSYRYFDAQNGGIMPSDITRFNAAGVTQYPLGTVRINTVSARYRYNPADNDLINVTANLWRTGAKSRLLNGFLGPRSQDFNGLRSWVPTENNRVGGDFNNRSTFSASAGEFNLDLGGGFQFEEIKAQDGVVITEQDINSNRIIRDGNRREVNLTARFEYKPTDNLELWVGGRYSNFHSDDNNVLSSAKREDVYGRYISVTNADGKRGNLHWLPDAQGNFTDATDPRKNNGIVFDNTNNPFEGIPYDEFGATSETVGIPGTSQTVTGFDHSKPLSSKDSGFAPTFGINYEFKPDSFIYATYSEGLRMPGLFETSLGTLQVTPIAGLEPERSKTWEIGASTIRHNVFTENDNASIKLAYFDTKIEDFISRYNNPTFGAFMVFSNAESYKTNGVDLKFSYDNGKFFTDIAATRYFDTETCDSAIAGALRDTQIPSFADTPNCTPGSFYGSYSVTQNPPKFSLSTTLGARLFSEKLTIGGRMTRTSGPVETLDQPWQKGTTVQIYYHPVTVFDAFASYDINDTVQVNASVNNIRNRYYLDPLAQSFMPAPGRTARVDLTVKF